MGVNYECYLTINVKIKPGIIEIPDTWIKQEIGTILEEFEVSFDTEDMEVESKFTTNQDEEKAISLSLYLNELMFGLGYDEDGNKIASDITEKIEQVIKSVEAVGAINFYGYMDDRDPDFSAYLTI